MIDVVVDGTPLLGPRTGVGRHVAGLLGGLRDLSGVEPHVTAFTWRHAQGLNEAKVAVRHRRFPARLLQSLWQHFDWPSVELLSGGGDVFHATNFVLPPLRRMKGVVTVHDTAYLDHPETVSAASRRYRELVPAGLRRAGAVCTVTRTVAERLIETYDLDPNCVVVTPNGLDPIWLARAPEPDPEWLAARGLPARYVLYVGAAEPRKNLPVLLDAMARLGGEPALVLAGPSGWGPPLDVDALPAGSVIRTGYLDDVSLARVTAGATCLVLPSRDEGFGLTPLEAMACGVPVVVSDLPALREVLGELATYVPVGDSDALADAIAATVTDGGAVEARRARREHARAFTWQHCAQQAMRAYQIALGN